MVALAGCTVTQNLGGMSGSSEDAASGNASGASTGAQTGSANGRGSGVAGSDTGSGAATGTSTSGASSGAASGAGSGVSAGVANGGSAGASGERSGAGSSGGASGANVDGSLDAADAGGDAVPPDASPGNDATLDATILSDAAAGPDSGAPGSLCATTCGPGLFACGGSCWSSPTCAGACEPSSCNPASHAQLGCNNLGQCVIARCDPGWADCDGVEVNGCEADLSSPSTCNDCHTSCSGTNYLCSASGCVSACGSGDTFCGPNSCVDSATSPQDCGGCGVACTGAASNATSTCIAGACSPQQCAAGYASCNGKCLPASWVTCNGTCGYDTTSDPSNCGSCGNVCMAPQNGQSACVNSACIVSCAPAFSLCANACVQTAVDPANCGACGHACAAGQICVDPGSCVSPGSLILATGLAAPGALTSDATSLYWLDPNAFTVNTIPKSGGPVVTLATNQYDLINGLQITLDDTYVYWVANGTLRTRKDGTGSVDTVTAATAGLGLAVIGPNLYLGTPTEIDRVPASGGTPTLFVSSPAPGGIAACDGVYLYVLSAMVTLGTTLYVDTISPPGTTLVPTGLDGAHVLGSGQVKLGPGGAYFAFDSSYGFQVDGPSFGATSSTPVSWAPGPCGVLLDTAQGLELNEVVLLSSAAESSLGGLKELLYDDGYVYFIDGSGEIGKLAAR